jgi:hypothetical protein
MRAVARAGTMGAMEERYAIRWSDAYGPVETGSLELEETGLRFQDSGAHVHRVFYEDIESVRVGSGADGKPALVLDLAVGRSLRIGSDNGPGTLAGLAQRLGHLKATRLVL